MCVCVCVCVCVCMCVRVHENVRSRSCEHVFEYICILARACLLTCERVCIYDINIVRTNLKITNRMYKYPNGKTSRNAGLCKILFSLLSFFPLSYFLYERQKSIPTLLLQYKQIPIGCKLIDIKS